MFIQEKESEMPKSAEFPQYKPHSKLLMPHVVGISVLTTHSQ